MRHISFEESKWRSSWITEKDAKCFRIYEQSNLHDNDLMKSLIESNSRLVILNVIKKKSKQVELENFFNYFISVPIKANVEDGVNSLKV